MKFGVCKQKFLKVYIHTVSAGLLI